MTAFLLLSIIGKALKIRKFMAMNDLPEQSHKELQVSKRGAAGDGTRSLLIKCYLRQPGSSAAPSADPRNPRMWFTRTGPATVPGDGGPGAALFPGKRSRDTILPGQVHSHDHVDRDCVSVELKDEQGQRGQGRGSQEYFRVPISSLLVYRGPTMSCCKGWRLSANKTYKNPTFAMFMSFGTQDTL